MQKMFSTIITENGGYADLHMHTKLSDGTLSVDELLMLCKRKGLRCISITDHDNLDSYKLAEEPAKEIGLEIIPGIEISAVWQGKDIHILGYFCDPTNLALNMELEDFAKQRIARVKAIIKKLNALGIGITFEKVHSYCKGKIIGRPHIAMSLVDEEYISNFSEAFTKYLGDGCIAFVEKKGLPYSPTRTSLGSATSSSRTWWNGASRAWKSTARRKKALLAASTRKWHKGSDLWALAVPTSTPKTGLTPQVA